MNSIIRQIESISDDFKEMIEANSKVIKPVIGGSIIEFMGMTTVRHDERMREECKKLEKYILNEHLKSTSAFAVAVAISLPVVIMSTYELYFHRFLTKTFPDDYPDYDDERFCLVCMNSFVADVWLSCVELGIHAASCISESNEDTVLRKNRKYIESLGHPANSGGIEMIIKSFLVTHTKSDNREDNSMGIEDILNKSKFAFDERTFLWNEKIFGSKVKVLSTTALKHAEWIGRDNEDAKTVTAEDVVDLAIAVEWTINSISNIVEMMKSGRLPDMIAFSLFSSRSESALGGTVISNE